MEKVYDAYGTEIKVGSRIAWISHPSTFKWIAKGHVTNITSKWNKPVIHAFMKKSLAMYWEPGRISALESCKRFEDGYLFDRILVLD